MPKKQESLETKKKCTFFSSWNIHHSLHPLPKSFFFFDQKKQSLKNPPNENKEYTWRMLGLQYWVQWFIFFRGRWASFYKRKLKIMFEKVGLMHRKQPQPSLWCWFKKEKMQKVQEKWNPEMKRKKEKTREKKAKEKASVSVTEKR